MDHRETIAQRESTSGRRKRPASESTRLRTALAGPVEGREFLKRIPIRAEGGLLLVPTCRVVTIVAKGERLMVATVDQSEHTFYYRLKDLEARLDPAEFIRLSRSILVNLNAVSRIASGSSGTNTVIFENGQEMRMSRNQAARLRRVLLDLLG
jgi:DNA-binding LytR/AlgR family response regulator